MSEEERKVVRLNRAGGSRSVTVPKAWLRSIGLGDDASQAVLVLKDNAISVQPYSAEPDPFADSPGFPAFLKFLAEAAVRHPEHLTNAADVLAGDEDLLPP
jgi:hypothetical protein